MGNKTKENKKRFFYPNEVLNIQKYLSPNAQATFEFQIKTGTRIEEARGFKDRPIINEEEGRCSITLLKTKVRYNKKERAELERTGIKKHPEPRTIKIPSEYLPKLKKVIKNKKIKFLSTNAMNVSLKKSVLRYNQDNPKTPIRNPQEFSSHNIRKTFGTFLLSLGLAPSKVAQHLGHTEIVLMKNYASNDAFSESDKQTILKILGDLPRKLMPYRGLYL